ncbi:MAG: cob(I)yrinic acid a,c-diamide adenosyltransferase [Phycisphaerae bacterium]
MKIYTKFGDRGETALFDGTKVPKDHLRIETYGTVDELNSWLGVVVATLGGDAAAAELAGLLTTLQRQLFVLGADLATPLGSKNEAKVVRISEREVRFLEERIDAATGRLPALKAFVLPGGTVAAGQLHVARTVCRRAERLLVGLMEAEGEAGRGGLGQALIYLNRLSDLLFTLAREANRLAGRGDVEWHAREG